MPTFSDVLLWASSVFGIKRVPCENLTSQGMQKVAPVEGRAQKEVERRLWKESCGLVNLARPTHLMSVQVKEPVHGSFAPISSTLSWAEATEGKNSIW